MTINGIVEMKEPSRGGTRTLKMRYVGKIEG
jgi:hypothetical protein